MFQNAFQELQVVRRSLNLFRTQMMDLELAMLRQQTMVYPHMTEEDRYWLSLHSGRVREAQHSFLRAHCWHPGTVCSVKQYRQETGTRT